MTLRLRVALATTIALLGVVAFVQDAPAQAEGSGVALEREGSLRDRLAKVVKSARRRGFSGAVVVAGRGRPIVSRGVGFANRRRRIRITPRTVFDIGSIAKPLTLAAALALVDDRRLSLADRLGDLLPGVPPDKQAITLRQLLEHRAGLPEYVVDAPGGDFAELSRNESTGRILESPLRFAPGTDYGYSDAGYTIAAAVIEDVTGQPFEDFVRRRVLDRGAMRSAGFYGDRWRRSRVALGYGGRTHGARNAPDAWSHVSWSLKGAGGVIASADDLVSWTRRLWSGAVLERPTVRTFYEILNAPDRLPRGNGFAIGYGGENDYGFNSVVIEGNRANRVAVILSNSGHRHAERLARRFAPILFPKLSAD
jgi:CubicO group peptidase (beta-lactamase class C family)